MKNAMDFSKIYDDKGKLIGVLNYNEMIPIQEDQVSLLDIAIHKRDSAKMKHYKNQCQQELEWCRNNRETIYNKANVIYKAYCSGVKISCRDRCLNFPVLEKVCEKYNTDKK